MAKSKSPASGFPDPQELLGFIGRHPTGVGRREIARAFNVGAKQRNHLKAVLHDMEDEGLIARNRGARYVKSGVLPAVAVVEVTGVDTHGEATARPANWREDRDPPVILIKRGGRNFSAPGAGDRVLARLTRLDDHTYQAAVIRKLEAAPKAILGVFDHDNRLHPVMKGQRFDYEVPPNQTMGAEPGELVAAELMSRRRYGLAQAKIIERLGDVDGPTAFSKIAIHLQGIPELFSEDALRDAEAATAAPLGDRTDLRDVPLVTIDGEDARDFDDAVFAERCEVDEAGNACHWHVIVAIADVAWYVRPASPLDRDARDRGNSVYFPDRVVPMLPEALSNGWCSLKPDEDRPCLAVHMWITEDGRVISHRFIRALMRSAARLTYTQIQAARDGNVPAELEPLMDSVVSPLFGAYESLLIARHDREPLELNATEAKVIVDRETGAVTDIGIREQLDSHQLIEEFMIAANVAAATSLEKTSLPFLYRVHDEPAEDRLEAFREFADSLGLKFPKGQVLTPGGFNRFIRRAKDTGLGPVISQAVLRSQSQAVYAPSNDGHFGLALRRYCHFTSPIRRYADLVVHRSLIQSLKLGDGGFAEEAETVSALGDHVSTTERRAAAAERETVDRFVAEFFKNRVGEHMQGIVSGVAKFGLFVTLEGTASEGLVPLRSLPDDRYEFDEKRRLIFGKRTGLRFGMGDALEVIIRESNPISGSLLLDVASGPGKKAPGKSRGKNKRKSKK